jgi:broad specificity phosphatase PhoE
MGTLTLVRHGQARTFEAGGGQLTTIGQEQALALGRYWSGRSLVFNEVYSGTLERQRQTAEIVGQCFIDAGQPWPRLQLTPDLNEYDGEGILDKLVPALAERDQAFPELLSAFEKYKNTNERNRYFQKMFEAVTSVWQTGTLEVEGVESWSSFSTRAGGAIRRIISEPGSGRRIAVFTSGGVIGLALQIALDAPLKQALEINWRVRNCSLTDLIFNRERLSLDSFNAIPHLIEKSLHTFR